MTPDEKRENVGRIYNMLIDNLIDTLKAMRSRPDEIQDMPRNKHTIATLDELVGHLQTRQQKQIAKVK